MLHVRTELRDGPDDLMARDQRISNVAPFAVHHGQIGVTDSAGADIDLDLIRPQCTGIVGEWFEIPSGLLDGVGLNHGKAP